MTEKQFKFTPSYSPFLFNPEKEKTNKESSFLENYGSGKYIIFEEANETEGTEEYQNYGSIKQREYFNEDFNSISQSQSYYRSNQQEKGEEDFEDELSKAELGLNQLRKYKKILQNRNPKDQTTEESLLIREKTCSTNNTKFIKEKTWQLPQKQEYSEIQKQAQNCSYFWTCSSSKENQNQLNPHPKNIHSSPQNITDYLSSEFSADSVNELNGGFSLNLPKKRSISHHGSHDNQQAQLRKESISLFLPQIQTPLSKRAVTPLKSKRSSENNYFDLNEQNNSLIMSRKIIGQRPQSREKMRSRRERDYILSEVKGSSPDYQQANINKSLEKKKQPASLSSNRQRKSFENAHSSQQIEDSQMDPKSLFIKKMQNKISSVVITREPDLIPSQKLPNLDNISDFYNLEPFYFKQMTSDTRLSTNIGRLKREKFIDLSGNNNLNNDQLKPLIFPSESNQNRSSTDKKNSQNSFLRVKRQSLDTPFSKRYSKI